MDDDDDDDEKIAFVHSGAGEKKSFFCLHLNNVN